MSSSLNDIAYAHICKLLVEDKILPDHRLSEQNIAKELGISRTPVREAIRRLCGEGVLRQVPSSGTYLTRPSIDDIQEIYEVRETLECHLVKKAVPFMTHRDYKLIRGNYLEMQKAVKQMKESGAPFLVGEPLARFLKADWSFHRHLLESAGNQYALKLLDDAQLKGCVFGVRSHRRNVEHLDRVLYLHQKIGRAVTKGDAVAAANWLRTHIRESRRDSLNALRETEVRLGQASRSISAYSAFAKNS